MNITIDLLKFVAARLRDYSGEFVLDTEEHDVFSDAADALDDARDLLEDIG